MQYSYAGYSDVGGRSNNEDAFLTIKSKWGYLFVVADGLGGHGKGEVASEIAVEELKNRFYDKKKFDLNEAIQAANHRIVDEQKEVRSKMKTTIAVAWIGERMTQFAYLGDSRIYAFDAKGIIYQSLDHSMAQVAAHAGEITAAEIRDNEDRNVLTKVLGVSGEQKVSFHELPNDTYERLLLCSDGFWEYVFEEEMCKTRNGIQTPKMWLRKMKRILQKRVPGGHDNHTAIAVMKRGGKQHG